MLFVLRPVARDIKSRKASSVFSELVTPEISIGLVLRDPELLHVRKKIKLSKGLEERPDVGAGPGWDGGSSWFAGCGVWRRQRVVLARQVAVLCVATIAKIRP